MNYSEVFTSGKKCQSPGAAGPTQAQLRGGGGGRARAEGPSGPTRGLTAAGGGRRRPGPGLPGAQPGGPLCLPRAPRLARQAPGPGSAAALTASLCACAAHLRVPLGGGEVTR